MVGMSCVEPLSRGSPSRWSAVTTGVGISSSTQYTYAQALTNKTEPEQSSFVPGAWPGPHVPIAEDSTIHENVSAAVGA